MFLSFYSHLFHLAVLFSYIFRSSSSRSFFFQGISSSVSCRPAFPSSCISSSYSRVSLHYCPSYFRSPIIRILCLLLSSSLFSAFTDLFLFFHSQSFLSCFFLHPSCIFLFSFLPFPLVLLSAFHLILFIR